MQTSIACCFSSVRPVWTRLPLSRCQGLYRLGMVLLLLVVIGLFAPASALAAAPPDRLPLTLDRLQEQLKSPTASEGAQTLDFRRFIIDLRSENADFREQFYRQIRAQLRRSSGSLGLDFSYSLIQGELDMSELGIRVPLYGQSTLPIFTETEQVQLQRDRRRLSQLSQLSRSLLAQTQVAPLQITVLRGNLALTQTRFEGFAEFTNTFFLGRMTAEGATFTQETDWSEARFGQTASFTNAVFQREARFRSAIFFQRARFNQAQFLGSVTFQNCEFGGTASFHQALFQQLANFSRIQWQDIADLAQTRWENTVIFDRSKFTKSLFLTESIFERLASFRQVQFNQSVNLRGAGILALADFADAGFAANAHLNIPNLQFDPKQATILGDPGQLGRVLSVPALQGNETLLRKLVQNFRQLQQIPDANQIEYTKEKLRLKALRQRLVGTDLNTASVQQLRAIGFSDQQASVILQARARQPFRNLNDLLKLETIDLATYVKIRDRALAGEALTLTNWVLDGLHWVGLSLLLLLTRYGTSFWLVFGVGMVAIAFFSLVFWLVDRLRRRRPQPILPTLQETIWVLSGFALLNLGGISAIFRTSEHPWLTLTCLGVLIVPLPSTLLGLIYWRGRYHDLLTTSYFVEDGTLRQLRFLIGRLPIIPSYPLFRERYSYILWNRRWSWLNYFDFSLNNLLRFGFNDIRLRDQQMPGLVTSLVWYQWSIGILYFALLLWTLSRTIPGLNLLIYFK